MSSRNRTRLTFSNTSCSSFSYVLLRLIASCYENSSAPGKAKGFMGEFKAFIARGNVMDMAVGVIIGGAFGKISTSLVNDIHHAPHLHAHRRRGFQQLEDRG